MIFYFLSKSIIFFCLTGKKSLACIKKDNLHTTCKIEFCLYAVEFFSVSHIPSVTFLQAAWCTQKSCLVENKTIFLNFDMSTMT